MTYYYREMNLTITCINHLLREVIEGLQHLPLVGYPRCWNIAQKYSISVANYYEQKYGSTFFSFIIFSPLEQPTTTIFYTNLVDGWDTLVRHCAKQFDWEMFKATIIDADDNHYSGYYFHYYRGQRQRHILCYREPQWVFYEEGIPLPFENINLYSKRLKKGRLNKDIVLLYMSKAGWHLLSKDFWTPVNGLYYEYHQVKKLNKRT